MVSSRTLHEGRTRKYLLDTGIKTRIEGYVQRIVMEQVSTSSRPHVPPPLPPPTGLCPRLLGSAQIHNAEAFPTWLA